MELSLVSDLGPGYYGMGVIILCVSSCAVGGPGWATAWLAGTLPRFVVWWGEIIHGTLTVGHGVPKIKPIGGLFLAISSFQIPFRLLELPGKSHHTAALDLEFRGEGNALSPMLTEICKVDNQLVGHKNIVAPPDDPL